MEAATEHQLPTGTVTFLFTDIEGSTRLLADLGETYRDILASHAEILRSAIAGHHGTEVSTEGDAFFAVFRSARDAVAAASEAQSALAARDWPEGTAVRVRMGLHSGEGTLGGGGDNYLGMDVHRAARSPTLGMAGRSCCPMLRAASSCPISPPVSISATSVNTASKTYLRRSDCGSSRSPVWSATFRPSARSTRDRRTCPSD